MNVCICDDNKRFLDRLRAKIEPYSDNIYTYTTVDDLIKDGITFDLAFLDIELNDETDGFSAAKHVFNMNNECLIAFFTSHNEFAIKGYDFRAFKYILKQDEEKVIDKKIEDMFDEYNKRNKHIQGSYNGEIFKIAVKDILYIESYKRLVLFYTMHEKYEMYGTFRDIVSELSDYGFVQSHRSYLVNLKYISSLSKTNVILSNETVLPVGKKFYTELASLYIDRLI